MKVHLTLVKGIQKSKADQIRKGFQVRWKYDLLTFAFYSQET